MQSSRSLGLFQHLPWFAASMLLSLPVAAADTEYQLLVVACDQQNCTRFAEPRMTARSGQKISYSERNMKVEIETLSTWIDETDANVKVEIAHKNGERGNGAEPKRTTLILPSRVTSKTFTSLVTFVADGTIYHVWAKILPAAVGALR